MNRGTEVGQEERKGEDGGLSFCGLGDHKAGEGRGKAALGNGKNTGSGPRTRTESPSLARL